MKIAGLAVAVAALLAVGAAACGTGPSSTAQPRTSTAAAATPAPHRGAARTTPFGPYRFTRRPVVSFSLAIGHGNVPTYTAYVRLNRALPKFPNGDSSGSLKVDGVGGPSNPVLADRVSHCYIQYIEGTDTVPALRHPLPGTRVRVTVTLRVARRPPGLLRAMVPMRYVQRTTITNPDPDTINLRSLGCRHTK